MTDDHSAGREYMTGAFPGKKCFSLTDEKHFENSFRRLHDRSSVCKGE
jgi:hypothetical protein